MTLQGLNWNHHGSFPPWSGAEIVIEMHYNECRGYRGTEVKEERPHFASGALGLLAPGS